MLHHAKACCARRARCCAQSEADEVPTALPAGVEDILDELSKEEGIREVTLGRQAVSAGTVSQVGGCEGRRVGGREGGRAGRGGRGGRP